jgi:hypothetical protein
LRSPKSMAMYISACALVLVACSNSTVIDDSCFLDVAPITARSNVVAVGDTVTFDADLGPADCLPPQLTLEEWRWSSTDTLIARIDSLTGLAVGMSTGEIWILVEHAQARQVRSAAQLEVVAD